MAHFAKLDNNNIVTQIDCLNNNVINNLPFPESEPLGISFLQSLYGDNTTWVQTSYNNNFRFRYAGIGYLYSKELDAFIPLQPFLSWSLNNFTADWDPPMPYPNDGKFYTWDEPALSWAEDVVNQSQTEKNDKSSY